ncbi:hypothetical protein BOX15_Mlig021481g1, partial [Macrostomum lignano]
AAQSENALSLQNTNSALTMQEGCTVLLRKLIKGRRFYYRMEVLQSNASVLLKGMRMSLSDLSGHSFGTLFKLSEDSLRLMPVDDAAEFDQFEDRLVSELSSQNPQLGDPVTDRDNRNIVDSTGNQTLSSGELADLRDSGQSGRSVIERLIDRSANFGQKTSFSQEKYVRKKKEKYLDYVAALPPTVRHLCEMRGRGWNLRFDMLSQLLAYANVHCASRALLVDDSYNLLLTQAVCERLSASSGGRACLFVNCPMAASGPVSRLRGRCAQPCCCADGEAQLDCLPLQLVRPALRLRRLYASKAADSPAEPSEKKAKLEEPPDLSQADDSSALASGEWDCLLVASRHSPVSLLPLLDLLSPGQPFAFHSPYQDALVTLAQELTARGLANAGPLLLFDSFCRPWQLLPGRCRPAMRMRATGSGFALVGRRSGDGEADEDCEIDGGESGDGGGESDEGDA